MTLTYTLRPGDFLNYHLFISSLSDTLKEQRKTNRVIGSIVLLCLANAIYRILFFYQVNDVTVSLQTFNTPNLEFQLEKASRLIDLSTGNMI